MFLLKHHSGTRASTQHTSTRPFARSREGFLLTCYPLEGVTLAPSQPFICHHSPALDSCLPAGWQALSLVTGKAWLPHGCDLSREPRADRSQASPGMEIRAWLAAPHHCAKSTCWGQAHSGGFSIHRKIGICILLANRKTRILWGNSCFPFSCQPLKHLPSAFSRSLSAVCYLLMHFPNEVSILQIFVTDKFFVSSNNFPESKTMFLTQLVLHDEGVLKAFWHTLRGSQASYFKPWKHYIPC